MAADGLMLGAFNRSGGGVKASIGAGIQRRDRKVLGLQGQIDNRQKREVERACIPCSGTDARTNCSRSLTARGSGAGPTAAWQQKGLISQGGLPL
jgi:hypothetical protein